MFVHCKGVVPDDAMILYMKKDHNCDKTPCYLWIKSFHIPWNKIGSELVVYMKYKLDISISDLYYSFYIYLIKLFWSNCFLLQLFFLPAFSKEESQLNEIWSVHVILFIYFLWFIEHFFDSIWHYRACFSKLVTVK